MAGQFTTHALRDWRDEMNNGGPAFPIVVEGGENSGLHSELFYGMSLRDWFAGQALIGILGARNGFLVDVGTTNAPGWAYDVADAMLAARERQPVEDEYTGAS